MDTPGGPSASASDTHHSSLITQYSLKAGVGFLLSLSIVASVVGLLLSLHALREINSSDGRLRGQKLAFGGVILGAVGTILLALGMVAVVLVHVRGTSYRVECQNHLRHVGQALILYHEEHEKFPPGTVPSKDLPPPERLSWYVLLLPFLGVELPPELGSGQQAMPKKSSKQEEEWKALYRGVDLGQGWQADANRTARTTPVRWFRCPADPQRAAPGAPARTDYVGIAGVGEDAALLPLASPDAGVFGYDRQVSRTQVTRGISQTMMVTETTWQNGPWAAGGPATVRGLDPKQQAYLGVGRPFGGLHPDGLNVLFVDGSVQFLKQTMDPRLFERMATIRAEGDGRGEQE